MPDEPDPPRKHYKFKAAEFENINDVPRAQSLHENQPPPDPGIVVTDKVRIDVRDLARAANLPTATSAKPASAPAGEVQRILQANLAKADAAGLNDLAPAPKSTKRRKRDYTVTMIAGNATLAALAGLSGFNLVGSLFALGGMILFSLGATWIMWFVMDDY